MRIVMLYTDIESFNFFVDQMDREFRLRGHGGRGYPDGSSVSVSPHFGEAFEELCAVLL